MKTTTSLQVVHTKNLLIHNVIHSKIIEQIMNAAFPPKDQVQMKRKRNQKKASAPPAKKHRNMDTTATRE